MRPCQGLGRASATATRHGARPGLTPCPYDAVADDVLCGYHRKVVDQLITELMPGQRPSWPPAARNPGKPPAPRLTIRERLLEEWAL